MLMHCNLRELIGPRKQMCGLHALPSPSDECQRARSLEVLVNTRTMRAYTLCGTLPARVAAGSAPRLVRILAGLGSRQRLECTLCLGHELRR
jgi:hypothetical protein